MCLKLKTGKLYIIYSHQIQYVIYFFYNIHKVPVVAKEIKNAVRKVPNTLNKIDLKS